MSRQAAARRADDPAPRYYQFQRDLRARILRGEWQPGDQLPSEPALARDYGLSRGTIREGIELLLRDGLIERQHGRGTFLRDPRIVSEWNAFYGFMPALRSLGRKVSARPVAVQVHRAGEELAAALEIAAADAVVEVKRLLLVDGEPFLVTTAYLPDALCPGLAAVDFSAHWLFETLAERYATHIARQERWIEPILPQPADRALLGLAAMQPCLLVDEVSRDVHDRPVSTSRTVVRGDRCRPYFRVEHRPPAVHRATEVAQGGTGR
jgi:GntR family transcriptional regulator